MTKPRLILIDSFAHIYRAYHSNPNLTNGAAFFFTRMLQSFLKRENPTHLACVYDVDGGSHFRYALQPDYKGTRNERPKTLDSQLPLCKRIVKAMGIHGVEMPGHEADDVIGTLALSAARDGMDVSIFSPDKDFLQLVNDQLGISVFTTKEQTILTYDRAGCFSRMGVYPEQVVGYLSLLGDASDNVKGVEGIGEKGAAKLLETYGSIEGILANVGALPKKQQESVRAAMVRLPQTQRMVTIATDLDIPFRRQDFAYNPPEEAVLSALYMELGFSSLVTKDAGGLNDL